MKEGGEREGWGRGDDFLFLNVGLTSSKIILPPVLNIRLRLLFFWRD